MRKIVLSFVIVFETASGGFEQTGMGARAAALGNAYAGMTSDVWSISFNTAGLSFIDRFQASIFCSPFPYGIPDIAVTAVAAALPTPAGCFGFSLRKYGSKLYREFSGALAFAVRIGGVHVGSSLSYHSVVIDRYGSNATVGLDVGLLIPLFSRLKWGLSVTNINSPKIGTSAEKLPQSYTVGIAYVPVENISFSFDIRKEISFDPSAHFGFEYRMIGAAAIRGGISDQPTQFSGGTGVMYSFFQFDYAFSKHQELGWTHSFSITVR